MTADVTRDEDRPYRLARDLLTRRRLGILGYLTGADGPLAVDVLTDLLSGEWAPADSNERNQGVSLLHSDLPVLVEHGLVRVDRTAGTVEQGPRFDSVGEPLRAGIRYLESIERLATPPKPPRSD